MVFPLFDLQSLHYAYEDHTVALEDIHMNIAHPEKVVILGANGSGKSTLLKILNGLIFPARGKMLYKGMPLNEASLKDPLFNLQFRSNVGFVFQNTDAQLFCPTVEEEIAFGPAQLGLREHALEERVQEMMALFHLEALATRAPYHLSGGEKKRVALASVLAVRPEVLLLDEPTAALDPRSKWELVDLLISLNERGKTIVTATHDMEIVEIISDRLIILGENKRVLKSGNTQELLKETTVLTQANLIHTHVHAHAEKKHRHPHGHDLSAPHHSSEANNL